MAIMLKVQMLLDLVDPGGMTLLPAVKKMRVARQTNDKIWHQTKLVEYHKAL